VVFCVWFKRELGCSVQKETARRPGGHRDQCGAALDGRGRINSWDVAFFLGRAGQWEERRTYVLFLGVETRDQTGGARGGGLG
jgi:hypothetical protein